MAGQGIGAARSPAGRGHGPLTRQEHATLCPGAGVPGQRPATPAPEAPAGEDGESREAKPLWKLHAG